MTRRRSLHALAWLLASACSFEGAVANSTDDAPSIDAPVDVMIDARTARVTEGLIGLWTFDEATGATTAADTSGASSPVPLLVRTAQGVAAPVFGDGTVTATSRSRMSSMPERSRLSADIIAGGGVTLEVWLRPNVAMQGDGVTPRFTVGLAKNLTNRNIALLQRGNRWAGVVRTGAATAGTPELLSSSIVSTTEMTHVVIIADPTKRQLIVNDRVELVDPVAGQLSTWAPDALFLVFEEPTAGAFWTGTISLVALYARALSPDEVHANFVQGPDAR